MNEGSNVRVFTVNHYACCKDTATFDKFDLSNHVKKNFASAVRILGSA